MDARSHVCLLLIAAAVLMSGKGGGRAEGRTAQEDKAIKKVLRNMAKASKPMRLPPTPNNTRTPINVGLDFDLTAVSDVNVNGGFVDFEGLLNMMWVDPRLKFDLPKASKGIHTLRVNPKTIWTPDIDIYNGMAPGLQLLTRQTSAVVSRSGDVFLSNQVRLRNRCDIIGQLSTAVMLNCTVKMGAWAYNGLEIQLSLSSVHADKLQNFEAAGLWTATAATAWVGAEVYPCCPESYPYIRFSFLLKKRSVPHWLNEKRSDA